MLVAVNFHYVRARFDEPFAGIHGETADQFEAQLLAMRALAPVIAPTQLRTWLRSGEDVGPCWLVTFDDGLREQFEVAWPILQRLGMSAAFFASTQPRSEGRMLEVHKVHLLRARTEPDELLTRLQRELTNLGSEPEAVSDERVRAAYRYDEPEAARLKYLLNVQLPRAIAEEATGRVFEAKFGREEPFLDELYMTTRQLRELAAYGLLFSHCHSHKPIGLLPDRQRRREIEIAQHWLTEWTGEAPTGLSYPYGFRAACPTLGDPALAGLGLEFGFTMERAGNSALGAWPLHMARFSCNDIPGGRHFRGDAESFFATCPAASWYDSDSEPA